jgi:hypothetical protein
VRRAFPDTSVLYPSSLLDLFMRLAERRVHTIVWSDDLLDELGRVWAEGRAAGRRVPSTGGAAAALEGIRKTFSASLVQRHLYEPLIDRMPGNDLEDKPHTAAAVAGRATHIVTSDRSGGFPRRAIRKNFGILVTGPDAYLADVAREFPDDCRGVVQEMVTRRARSVPTWTVEAQLQRWEETIRLRKFVKQLRR